MRHFEEGKGAATDERSAFEWSQTTWSLGAAAIFYGELAARGTRRKDSIAHLRAIGDLLARSQQPDGGFGHDKEGRPRIPEIEMPMPGGGVKKMKYPNTLLSASNWAANALGIARPVRGRSSTTRSRRRRPTTPRRGTPRARTRTTRARRGRAVDRT